MVMGVRDCLSRDTVFLIDCVDAMKVSCHVSYCKEHSLIGMRESF